MGQLARAPFPQEPCSRVRPCPTTATHWTHLKTCNFLGNFGESITRLRGCWHMNSLHDFYPTNSCHDLYGFPLKRRCPQNHAVYMVYDDVPFQNLSICLSWGWYAAHPAFSTLGSLSLDPTRPTQGPRVHAAAANAALSAAFPGPVPRSAAGQAGTYPSKGETWRNWRKILDLRCEQEKQGINQNQVLFSVIVKFSKGQLPDLSLVVDPHVSVHQ